MRGSISRLLCIGWPDRMTSMIECKDIQSDKFKDAAREAECDEDEARWKERLKTGAKQQSEKPE